MPDSNLVGGRHRQRWLVQDVHVINPCIKVLVFGAAERDWQVVGIRRGWAGLIELNPDEPATLQTGTLELNRQITRTIDRGGGTFLHTSRVDSSRVRADRLPAFVHQCSDVSVGSDSSEFDGVYAATKLGVI